MKQDPGTEQPAIAAHWQRSDKALLLSLRFSDFAETFAFMAEVALLAERQQHHPQWRNSYNTLDIALTTHDCDGLSARDFHLAAAIDRVLARCQATICPAASPP